MSRKVPIWKTPLPWVCLVIGAQTVLLLAFLIHFKRRSGVESVPSRPVPPTAGTVAVSIPPMARPSATPVAVSAPAQAPPGGTDVSMRDALGRDWIGVQFRGNGREQLIATLTHRRGSPLLVRLPAGLLLESEDRVSQVVALRGDAIPLTPGETRDVMLVSAATRASNALGQHTFFLREGRLPQLDRLLQYLEKSPEVSAEAAQTAVLAVLENPPLGMFARFTLVSAATAPGQAALPPGPAHFRVGTSDIIQALLMLKEIGHPMRDLLLAHEPQLKIEAMIDPLAHADAMRFYGIRADQEWDYWKDELLSGDVSTRHYALYGVGRYYPDTALQMLPLWARKTDLPLPLRVAAIFGMAETGRPEAVSVLQQMQYEFGVQTELGQAAKSAIGYLENRRDRPATARPTLEFKGGS